MLARKPIPVNDLKTTRNGEVRRRSIFWRWRRMFFLIGLLMATATAGIAFVLSQIELPNNGFVAADNQTSYLCDGSVTVDQPCTASNAIAAFHGGENREDVKYEDLPQVLIDAVVAAEDRDYFDHAGVNPTGILRAAITDVGGGSTITQQYVKNVFLTNERTLTRKIKEAAMAVKLEQKIEKEEILERYLNVIYWGRGAYGAKAASQAYFRHDLKDLGLHEAALLAGLIRSPETAEPYEDPKEATRRRQTVLVAMEQEGYITQEAVDLAGGVPLDEANGLYRPKVSNGVDFLKPAFGNEYFVEYVKQQVEDKYGEAALYGGGLRIYTTLDPLMQKAAYESVHGKLANPGDPSGSLVALNELGQVKAMVGGKQYGTGEGQSVVNLAVGKDGGGGGRQAGSTFKTFALAEAVKQGFSIESKFDSPPVKDIDVAGTDPYRVKGGCCEGVATLVDATKHSANTVYVQLMVDLGEAKVIETARSLGINFSQDRSDIEVPSAVLGTPSVSVLDMVSAYSTFQNNGVHIDPSSILQVSRPDGSVRKPDDPVRRAALSPDQNAKVVHALRSVVEPGGTGRAAWFGRPIAGKTGTTQNNVDAWFIGFTPKLTAGVWIGYPGAEQMSSDISGGKLPAEIWNLFMKEVADVDAGNFPKPKDDVLFSGEYLHPEMHTTTTPSTQAPPPTTEAPDRPTTTQSTERPPDQTRPTWPRPTWPGPTWPGPSSTPSTQPGNGGGRPPTTPAPPTTRPRDDAGD